MEFLVVPLFENLEQIRRRRSLISAQGWERSDYPGSQIQKAT